MKRSLVLAFLVMLGLGIAAYGGAISGSFDATAVLAKETQTSSNLVFNGFRSTVSIDYSISGFVFGFNALFTLQEWENLWFEAEGGLGAFHIKTLLDFVPVPTTAEVENFDDWLIAVDLSIAGVTLYDIFVLSSHGYSPGNPYLQTPSAPVAWTTGIGAGNVIGGYGTVGDVSIHAQAQFNIEDMSYVYWLYGLDFMEGRFVYTRCDVTTYKPYGYFDVMEANCDLNWSGFDIYVETPFTCFDMMMSAHFSCNGFDGFDIEVYNIDFPIDWIELSELDLSFTTLDRYYWSTATSSWVNYQDKGKSIDLYFGVVVGESVCFTPYIELIQGTNQYDIDGLRLNALLLEYSFNGVTFMAGELFLHAWPDNWGSTYSRYFTPSGGITTYAECAINTAYEEYFGVIIDGDSCCGGSFEASVFTWFDTDDTGTSLFDLEETTLALSLGLGANSTFNVGVSYVDTGLNWLSLGIEFTF